MPETATEATPTAETPVPAEVQKSEESNDKPLGENGEKALKAERTRATAAERERDALKAQLDKIAEANLSDLDKARKEADEFKALAEKANVDALRFRIAAEAGITENVDLILTAPDEETMRRQAALWATKAEEKAAAGPRADLSQGGSGTAIPLNGDGLEEALKSKLGI